MNEQILQLSETGKPERHTKQCKDTVLNLTKEIKQRRKDLRKKREWNKLNAENPMLYRYMYIKVAVNIRDSIEKQNFEFWEVL